MELLGRIILPAVIAGILAGLLLTGLQYIEVIPLIHEAENYESSGANSHEHDTHDHEHGHDHVGGAWAPDDGLERFAVTILSNVLAAIGFGLILSVSFSLLTARGRALTWRHGVLWGLAGCGIFTLAPALGLPPELPGSDVAPLAGRQIWWVMTVLLTGLGLGLIAFARPVYLRALGLVPIALPHIIGAPIPDHHGGLVPAEIAQRYVYASLITSGLFWLALGVLAAFLHRRFGSAKDLKITPTYGSSTGRES